SPFPVPEVAAVKSVDPESGTAVVAGQEVEYTLTFANTGNAAGPVEYTDDLSGVLDDADLVGDPVVSDPALTADVDGESLTVSGSLEADQEVTVTYTAVVGADFERGDNVLGNILAPADAVDPQCGDEGVSCTENPIPQLD
ncbi:MAG: hypothetical protein ACQEW8_15595, partial [Actinomycetota bacterium]